MKKKNKISLTPAHRSTELTSRPAVFLPLSSRKEGGPRELGVGVS